MRISSSGGALLGDNAAGKDNDFIRAADGAHPVGDDQHRFLPDQPGQGGLDLRFILYIKACSSFIQQNDGSVF